MIPVKPDPVRGRTYGGQSPAQRSAERRAALLEAAFSLVAEHGWRELRIDALCRSAGLNKRYFYESFSDLDALVSALTDGLARETIAAALAGIGPRTAPEAATRRAVDALVGHLTDDPRRARVLFGAVPATEAAAGHRTEAIRRIVAAAAGTGQGLHHLRAGPELDIAAAMLVGGTSQTLLDWLDGRIPASRPELVDSLVGLWQAVEARTVDQARRHDGI
ncbi:MAG TPA: TetR/AcrR family transcriptional regulator [Solirubrobacteraceae bacterium]|nr:TetR/AcrR family transcriptional regulator [Solirubrobacteraceae bacterium]